MLNRATILALLPWPNSNLDNCILTPILSQLFKFGIFVYLVSGLKNIRASPSDIAIPVDGCRRSMEEKILKT